MSRTAMLFAAALLLASPVQLDGQSSWNELVDLFGEWREFERPEFIDGVPDYTATAMAPVSYTHLTLPTILLV